MQSRAAPHPSRFTSSPRHTAHDADWELWGYWRKADHSTAGAHTSCYTRSLQKQALLFLLCLFARKVVFFFFPVIHSSPFATSLPHLWFPELQLSSLQTLIRDTKPSSKPKKRQQSRMTDFTKQIQHTHLYLHSFF